EQVRAFADGLDPERARDSVVAYELCWVIGAGVTPSDAEIEHALGDVRHELARALGEQAAARVPILYGGSATADNAAAILAIRGCGGLLVGGASLDPKKLLRIAGAR